MQRTILKLMVSFLVAIAALAQGAKPVGDWKGEWGKMPVTLKLHAEGNSVGGTLEHQFPCGIYCNEGKTTGTANNKIEDVKVAGDAIQFKCEIVGPEGRSDTVAFKGVFDKDKLTLTPQKPAAETPFTLHRVQ